MIGNPFAANSPLMGKPVAYFALVSCMNNIFKIALILLALEN